MHPHNNDMYLKYYAAQELGLMEKLLRVGWSGLTARETGQIGGIVRQMKKQRKEP